MARIEEATHLIGEIKRKAETMGDDKLAPIARKLMSKEVLADCDVVIALLEDDEDDSEEEEEN